VVIPPFGDLGAEGQGEEAMGLEDGIDCGFGKRVLIGKVQKGAVGEVTGGRTSGTTEALQ
jgi:hypothetical protein